MVKRTFAALALVTLCLLLLTVPVYADDASDAELEIADKLSDMADSVTEETDSPLSSALSGTSVEETGEALIESLEPTRLVEWVAGLLSVGLGDAIHTLCLTVGLVVISAVCEKLCASFESGALASGVRLCGSVAVMAAFISTQTDAVERVGRFFSSLCELLGTMIPVSAAVWAMGGNVLSASVGSGALYALLAAAEGAVAATVAPVCYTMGMSAICASLSDGSILGGFTGAVKKIYNFFIAAVMTVIVFALGVQTTIAGAADTAAARGAKLLSSTVIPVVGGAVGDTLRTVAGSVQYVKSVVGVGGIALVLSLTLPTFISVLLSRLVFLISSSVADTLGCRGQARLLDELGNVYGCLLGAVSICAIAFIVSLAIFTKCTVAVA